MLQRLVTGFIGNKFGGNTITYLILLFTFISALYIIIKFVQWLYRKFQEDSASIYFHMLKNPTIPKEEEKIVNANLKANSLELVYFGIKNKSNVWLENCKIWLKLPKEFTILKSRDLIDELENMGMRISRYRSETGDDYAASVRKIMERTTDSEKLHEIHNIKKDFKLGSLHNSKEVLLFKDKAPTYYNLKYGEKKEPILHRHNHAFYTTVTRLSDP